jgi:hypothetical protein
MAKSFDSTKQYVFLKSGAIVKMIAEIAPSGIYGKMVVVKKMDNKEMIVTMASLMELGEFIRATEDK